MIKYKPKRLLLIAINAIETALIKKWSSKNVEAGSVSDQNCDVCSQFGTYTGSVGICRQCPLRQYRPEPIGTCNFTYSKWVKHSTRANARAMRKELKNTVKWLRSQLDVSF